MFKKNKENTNEEVKVNEMVEELNLDKTEEVAGGSLRNAPKTKPVSISQDTKNKI